MRQRGNPLILPIHEILALLNNIFYLIPGHTQQYSSQNLCVTKKIVYIKIQENKRRLHGLID